MEEPTYEYDWRHPIEVPNPNNKSGISIENGSYEWFKLWLKKDCTYQQIADHFNTSKQHVSNMAKLFKWKERKRNKEDHDTRQREKLQQQRYQEFIDKDYKNAKTQMDALYTLSQIALIYLGVLPNNGKLEIPEGMTVKQATKILQGNPKAIRQMHNQILRDLEKPNTINDNQTHKIDAELEISTRFKKIFNKDRLNERYKK
jgi:hypothetical protein